MRFVIIALLAGGLGATAPAIAARTECRATLDGIASPTGDRCAGVRVCIEGPEDACQLAGSVVLRLPRRAPIRVRPDDGARCVTVTPSDGFDAVARARITARVGKGRGRSLRVRAPLTCRTWSPPVDDGTCAGLAIPAPVVGRRAHFPPSVHTEGTCDTGESPSNYTTPSRLVPPEQRSELHVISMYEPACSRRAVDWPFECVRYSGPITVVVEPRPQPIVLALAATEAVTWQLEILPGAIVERVITSSYMPQTVKGVPAAIVSRLDEPRVTTGWEMSRGGANGLVGAVREATGLVETSFQGCYTGVRFTIPHIAEPATTCEASPVTGDERIPQGDVDFPACADVASESAACISVIDGSVVLLGADSGAVCPLTDPREGTFADTFATSVGWLGEVLYRCTYEVGLERLDLRSGARESLQMPCNAVTDDRGTLLIAPPFSSDIHDFGTIHQVAGYDGLVSATSTRLPASTWNSRFAAHGGLLYSAWHATNTIDVQDLATGAMVRQVRLEGYEDWIMGLDVTDDGRLFVSGFGDTGMALLIFDASTGARLGQQPIDVPSGAVGLACHARAAASAPDTTTSTAPDGDTGAGCIRTGCSGQVCASRTLATTCEWNERYTCYRSARCEQQVSDGRCAWTPTPELSECLATHG